MLLNQHKFFLIIIVLFSLTKQAYTKDKLLLLTLNYPPYEYEVNGKVVGIAVEVVKETFKRMNQDYDIQVVPWARALKMIETGQADGLFTAFKKEERLKYAHFSSEVLMDQEISLFVHKDSQIAYTGNLELLRKHSFGIVRKVSYGKIFDRAIRFKHINTQTSPDSSYNIQKFLARRFDILPSNRLGALHEFSHLGVLPQIRELKPSIEKVPSYMMFSKKNKLKEIQLKFDKTLKSMKADGSYQRIISSSLKLRKL